MTSLRLNSTQNRKIAESNKQMELQNLLSVNLDSPIILPIMEKKKRLSKALAGAGIASRRAAEEIIFEGRVKVNGVVVTVPQTLVDWEDDTILVDESPVKGEERKVYFILNKPHGYVCSNTRLGSKKLVVDLFAHLNLRLLP